MFHFLFVLFMIFCGICFFVDIICPAYTKTSKWLQKDDNKPS